MATLAIPQALSQINTPDRRVRVFLSSTLKELGAERGAARDAITSMHLTPVMFETCARAHSPRELYRSYLEQSDIFVGIHWQRYGWVAPAEAVSGLEDEYMLSGDKPKLIYIKSADSRESRLSGLLERITTDDRVSYKHFESADELKVLLADDLALLLTERFSQSASAPEGLRAARLPAPPTAIIGRAAELETVRNLLCDSTIRLVTLVGMGGIGKTRVAVETANQLNTAPSSFADRVWFVDLSTVTDPSQWAGGVAAALGVRPEGNGPVLDLLIDRLRAYRRRRRDRPLVVAPGDCGR